MNTKIEIFKAYLNSTNDCALLADEMSKLQESIEEELTEIWSAEAMYENISLEDFIQSQTNF